MPKLSNEIICFKKYAERLDLFLCNVQVKLVAFGKACGGNGRRWSERRRGNASRVEIHGRRGGGAGLSGSRGSGGRGGVHLHHFYVDFLGYIVDFTASIHPCTDLLALNYISIHLCRPVAGALKFARYLKLFHLKAFLTLAQTNKKTYLL